MRLVSFRKAGEVRLGGQLDGAIVDLQAAHAANGGYPSGIPNDAAAFLATGQKGLDAAARALDFAAGLDPAARAADGLIATDHELLPPIPRPPKIICVARNYARHAAEANLEVLKFPNLFARWSQTLIADGAPIVVPRQSDEVDWEGELVAVIGRGGRYISEADAFDHVVGYSLFNDVSIRDYQFRVPQMTVGKNFDDSGPFGPALVTADEVPDPQDLDLELTVNGVVKQSGNTSDMVFSIPRLIAEISTTVTLEPGDVIMTGTPEGVGFTRKPPEFLQAGDVCRVTIEHVGVLENPVVAEEVE